jgi:cell fate regulator YaaT (PSP1 superfamily)
MLRSQSHFRSLVERAFDCGLRLMSDYIVRYGSMRLLGAMSARSDAALLRGTKVIVRTSRGLEVGEVLCAAPAEPRTDEGTEAQGQSATTAGQILREMSGQDANELAHIQNNARDEFRLCHGHIQELALDMQLVDVEHLFGGERIIVYYLAEGRIDFRELVRRLATEFQTRIEMRQIGVRDEAKLLADYGDCGKTVCCGSHLIEMPPVSMKMAKLQKATLDPTKISGRCGRLKCCLRYEYDTYLDLQRELPPINSEIVTQQGRARVLGHEILAQQLLVQMEDNRRLQIGAGDVVSVIRKSNKGKPKD